ncbi:Scavenger receptor class B member 1 [Eumeta japonica]|uniref:Scavenger receptor class B member 1 n=1 Tax=Eumeta variegata TaxID=151549 RepID=A0A4C1UFB1_EUMVA|nr:Scavenger receptor class B member 1 [Eumeta japonica]
MFVAEELVTDGIRLYRYNLSETVHERIRNATDCYDTTPSLPSGLSDGSKCYYDFPMVLSYPHFYTGLSQKEVSVTGLKPDRERHNSFAVVEPLTGTPFVSIARMQSNLRVHDLSGFSSAYDRFSNSVLPMFWVEYVSHQYAAGLFCGNRMYEGPANVVMEGEWDTGTLTHSQQKKLSIHVCILSMCGILAPLACGLQEMVTKMNDAIEKRVMKGNVSKTKVMVFENGERTTEYK